MSKYIPLFELGIQSTKPLTPVVKVLKDCHVDETLLSLLLTVLCEFNINRQEESKQIEYEERLKKEFALFMEKRFNLNVTKQHC